jgi:periplasmic divalent cation tolerance protein
MKRIQVITTTDKEKVAARIAEALVRERLAACVQAWPITSTFPWRGKLTVGKEWILLIKARSPDYKRIEKEIARMHNYELPEIIALPILKGSRAYLDWMDEATK